jgi:hypothetical protein
VRYKVVAASQATFIINNPSRNIFQVTDEHLKIVWFRSQTFQGLALSERYILPVFTTRLLYPSFMSSKQAAARETIDSNSRFWLGRS